MLITCSNLLLASGGGDDAGDRGGGADGGDRDVEGQVVGQGIRVSWGTLDTKRTGVRGQRGRGDHLDLAKEGNRASQRADRGTDGLAHVTEDRGRGGGGDGGDQGSGGSLDVARGVVANGVAGGGDELIGGRAGVASGDSEVLVSGGGLANKTSDR